MICVEQGKRHKDRYVMLPEPLLALLRAWWIEYRSRSRDRTRSTRAPAQPAVPHGGAGGRARRAREAAHAAA